MIGDVMLLSKLTSGRNAVIMGEDRDIKTCYSYSKKKVEDGLFFCLDGGRLSGADFVDEAEKFGAVAVVTNKPLKTPLTQVIVDDVRAEYSALCAAFYGNPQKSLKIIGVVGTNGKTSTCSIVEKIFSCAGEKIGNIGTNGCFFEGERTEGGLTTPDPEVFFRVIKDMLDRGAKYVVTEVSAHAIKLKKLSVIDFDTLIFTNCTEDHLDYFQDMQSYSAVKRSIFTDKTEHIIVNGDDALGRDIAAGIASSVTYGIFEPSEVFAAVIKENKTRTTFVLNIFDELYDVNTKLLGLFNVYNVLAAVTCAFVHGIAAEVALSALRTMSAVSGRMERVAKINGGDVYVDYAHTPDGLEKSLLYLRKVTRGDLIVVFGCGGDREKQKRPLMGRTAGDIADLVIITSDNPRFEDADLIITQIENGAREATDDYVCIKDRRAAIDYALRALKDGDTLLIAGKGAENYQEIMGVKKYFSDKDIVLSFAEQNV